MLKDDFSPIDEAECFVDGSHWVRVKKNSEGKQLKLILNGDGVTSVVTKDGREARAPLASNVYYHYFDDTALLKGDYNVYIAVEYYDEGTQEFCIEYQSTSKVWETTPFIWKKDTKKWKTDFFYLEHAAFGNGQNYGADFRVDSPHHDLAVARVGVLIPGQGLQMSPIDSRYDSLAEIVEITLPKSSDDDFHGVYIRGKDAAGNWGYNWFCELLKLPITQTGGIASHQMNVNYFSLEQNYPNPFNCNTIIKYSMPKYGHAGLSIYNILGEKVTELINKYVSTGEYEINWNAINYPCGLYFCVLTVDGTVMFRKKLVLIK